MKQYKKELGKVSVSAEGKWNIENAYERISMVFDEHTEQAFISKCDVPVGIDLYNREYWMPLNVSGYSDSNIIILNKKINDYKIKSYTLEEAIKSIKPVGRKPGCILVFYNSNTERLDIGGCWEIWQFNDTNIYNWENIKSWQNIYYNYNKFVGWYSDEKSLKKYNLFPEIGCYAYVGSELNNSVVFRCDSKYVWTRTKETAKDYVKVILDGTITIGENGNWYQNGKDTNIPASVKGDDGKTPFIRNINNILEYSYDEIEWRPISEQIAAWFRWKAGDADKHHIGNIQISRDNVTWQNLSGDIVSSLHISKHIGINEQLPTNVAEGTIIAKRTSSTNTTSYELFVYAYNESNILAWISHGIFTSISVGLTQETGDNENMVMSQKAVTDNLNTVIEAVTENNQALYPLEMTVTGLNNPYEEGVNATITLNISNKYKGSIIHPDDVYTEVNGVEISDGRFTETINSSKVYNIESSYAYMYLNKNATINATKTLNAVFVKPCWLGFSKHDSMEDIDMDETGGFTKYIKTNPNGTYTIEGNSEGYVWLCVPNTMSINKVTMSGFEFPVEELNTGGVTGYRNYRSSNKLLAGSYTIVIS